MAPSRPKCYMICSKWEDKGFENTGLEPDA